MIGAASLPVTAHPVLQFRYINYIVDWVFRWTLCLLNVWMFMCICCPGISQEGKKHVSNKTVIVTLLVCVILTTIAFLGTTAYYLRRKDALSPHSHAYSFDKYTSWSSRSNLVSHRSSPLPQPKPKPRISVLKGKSRQSMYLWIFFLRCCACLNLLQYSEPVWFRTVYSDSEQHTDPCLFFNSLSQSFCAAAIQYVAMKVVRFPVSSSGSPTRNWSKQPGNFQMNIWSELEAQARCTVDSLATPRSLPWRSSGPSEAQTKTSSSYPR